MENILHIETATDICSVALTDGDKILAIRETVYGKSHAGVLTVFIKEILEEQKYLQHLLMQYLLAWVLVRIQGYE